MFSKIKTRAQAFAQKPAIKSTREVSTAWGKAAAGGFVQGATTALVVTAITIPAALISASVEKMIRD